MIGLLSALTLHGALLLAGGPPSPSVYRSLADLIGGYDQSVLLLSARTQNETSLIKSGFSHITTDPTSLKTNSLKAVVVLDEDPQKWMAQYGKYQSAFESFMNRGGIFCAFGSSSTLVGESAFAGDQKIAGLSLFDGIVQIDYLKKHREIALRNAYFETRVQLGIGLDEDQWIVLRDNVIEKKVGLPQVFLREAG